MSDSYAEHWILTVHALKYPHLNMWWWSLRWCSRMSSPNEDGFDVLFGDILLWKWSLMCPFLLACDKIPSHKIISKLSFASNYWAFGQVQSGNNCAHGQWLIVGLDLHRARLYEASGGMLLPDWKLNENVRSCGMLGDNGVLVQEKCKKSLKTSNTFWDPKCPHLRNKDDFLE